MRWLSQLWTQLWITLVVAAVTLALYASLGRQLIPLVETLRPDIEQQLSAAIQQPVTIGAVTGGWHLLAPKVTLDNITLGDPATGVRIGTVSAELDISASAFHRLPVFKRIEISQVRGHIKQLGKKHWQLAKGWHINTSAADATTTEAKHSSENTDAASSRRPLWLQLLELQQAIVLSDWLINHDGLNVSDRLQVKQLLWRNRANSHAIGGQVSWGLSHMANITLKGTLQGQLWPWADQDAQFYASVDPQDWARWVPGDKQDNFHVTNLVASLQGWGTIVDGDLNSLYGNINMPSLQLQTPGQPMILSHGNIRMRAQRNAEEWHMRIQPDFEQALPFDEFTISAVPMTASKGWQFGIPQLNLAATTNLIRDHQLLPGKIQEYISNIAPSGVAKNVRMSLITGQTEQPIRLSVTSDLAEVSSQSYKGIPGFSNLSAELALTPQSGRLTVNDDQFGLFLDGIYDQSWPLDKPSGAFYWDIKPELYRLYVDDLSAEFNGVPLAAHVGLRIPTSTSTAEPNISVLLGFRQAPAEMRSELVPTLLGDATRNWIESAITAGQFSNGTFLLNGRLGKEIPANSNSLQLYMDLADGELNYLPDWPAVTGLHGRMLLNAPDLDVWVDRGKTLGGEFVPRSARVKLRPQQDHTLLHVSGQMTGEAAEGLRYFTETPLQQVVQNAFDQWQASGPLDVSMMLQMPLGLEDAKPQVLLNATLNQTQLHLGELNLDVNDLSGVLSFDSEQGISSNQLNGTLFGGRFSGGIESDPHATGFDMLLSATGEAQWQPVKQWMPLFLLDPISGELGYKASLSLKSKQRGGVNFKLNSDMIGTTIAMPAPMGKASDSRRPLSLNVLPGSETRINMNYDGLVKTALALDNSGLDRGQVYLGGNDPFLPSDKGVEIRGKIDQELKAEEWWALWQHLTAVIAAQEAAATTQTNEAAQSTVQPASSNPLRKIDVQIASVDSWGIPMGPVNLTADQEWNEWRFDLKSDLTKGLITLKPGDEPINLDLDYIHMPASDSADAASNNNQSGESQSQLPDPLQALEPADFPAVDMQLDEFYLGSRNFGSWQVSSRAADQGMHIQLHDSNMKGMNITGDIHWLKQQGIHTTQLDTLQVRSKNVGKVLRAFRQKELLDADKLRSSVRLGWQGSPMNFNLESLNGLANLRLDKGRLNAEGTDALKAFGALNFNSISRRLQLDFSDLYQSGLAFDVMKAKAKIEDGQLTLTEPLLVDGPGGKFLMSGNTNLIDHQMDMKLAVTFPVTGTLPMVAVLAGLAPPVAAAIYVSEKLVGDELERFTSASYTVKGTWEEPNLKIDQAFNNEVEGKETRSFKDRVLSIFGLDDD